jgi:hypothetical protein
MAFGDRLGGKEEFAGVAHIQSRTDERKGCRGQIDEECRLLDARRAAGV